MILYLNAAIWINFIFIFEQPRSSKKDDVLLTLIWDLIKKVNQKQDCLIMKKMDKLKRWNIFLNISSIVCSLRLPDKFSFELSRWKSRNYSSKLQSISFEWNFEKFLFRDEVDLFYVCFSIFYQILKPNSTIMTSNKILF